MTGPVNVKTISTLNVKSGRPGKCEKNSTLNVKKVWSVSSPVRWSVWTIRSAWSVNIPKVKNPGKCHDLERKCKMLIQGAFSWGFGCKK